MTKRYGFRTAARRAIYLSCVAGVASSLFTTSAGQAQSLKEEYTEFESREYLPFVAGSDVPVAPEAPGLLAGNIVRSFQGISQYDTAAVARNFIPPDTMGAVGTSQYMEFVNGGVAVFDKSTGARTLFQSDNAFWAAAGIAGGTNGDSRVMFDPSSNRWIASAFGASVANIQIAVSTTSDALGPWKSTVFTGFAGGTADYPTLALDKNAVYIGTNNFDSTNNFAGTTLNVIPIGSLINGTAPTTTGLQQFVAAYSNGAGPDRGFAIQGVNSTDAGTTGQAIASSLYYTNLITYKINNAGSGSATEGAISYINNASYDSNGAARQPNAVPDVDVNTTDTITSNDRVVDTLDDRIGSSVYKVNGRIYSVHTVTPTNGDYTVVRYDVIDAATGKLLAEGDIGDATHDYWEGSLAVNKFGQVVIAYNRSGRSITDGNITFAEQSFSTNGDGTLSALGGEQVIKVSLVDDYHNGSIDGQVAVGRQRWGDYSAVSVDPTDPYSFWVIGEYAREYNDAAGGHVGGTGGSRWSTWIAQVSLAPVPEPSTWAMMILGFGMMGYAMRRDRRSRTAVSFSA